MLNKIIWMCRDCWLPEVKQEGINWERNCWRDEHMVEQSKEQVARHAGNGLEYKYHSLYFQQTCDNTNRQQLYLLSVFLHLPILSLSRSLLPLLLHLSPFLHTPSTFCLLLFQQTVNNSQTKLILTTDNTVWQNKTVTSVCVRANTFLVLYEGMTMRSVMLAY